MSYLKMFVVLPVPLGAQVIVSADAIPNDRDAVVHALNRLTFGPGPSDVERVQRMGLTAWIDQQLNPSRINDTALDGKLTETPVRPSSTDPKEARRAAREDVLNLSGERLTREIYSDRQLEEVDPFPRGGGGARGDQDHRVAGAHHDGPVRLLGQPARLDREGLSAY